MLKQVGNYIDDYLVKNYLIRFWRDETGQSTTEYILILSVVVMIAMKFKTTFQGLLIKVVGQVGSQIQSATDQSGQ